MRGRCVVCCWRIFIFHSRWVFIFRHTNNFFCIIVFLFLFLFDVVVISCFVFSDTNTLIQFGFFTFVFLFALFCFSKCAWCITEFFSNFFVFLHVHCRLLNQSNYCCVMLTLFNCIVIVSIIIIAVVDITIFETFCLFNVSAVASGIFS